MADTTLACLQSSYVAAKAQPLRACCRFVSQLCSRSSGKMHEDEKQTERPFKAVLPQLCIGNRTVYSSLRASPLNLSYHVEGLAMLTHRQPGVKLETWDTVAPSPSAEVAQEIWRAATAVHTVREPLQVKNCREALQKLVFAASAQTVAVPKVGHVPVLAERLLHVDWVYPDRRTRFVVQHLKTEAKKRNPILQRALDGLTHTDTLVVLNTATVVPAQRSKSSVGEDVISAVRQCVGATVSGLVCVRNICADQLSSAVLGARDRTAFVGVPPCLAQKKLNALGMDVHRLPVVSARLAEVVLSGVDCASPDPCVVEAVEGPYAAKLFQVCDVPLPKFKVSAVVRKTSADALYGVRLRK